MCSNYSPASNKDDVVIQADNLSKLYRIYGHPSDRLKQSFFGGKRNYYREFWALREVSFSVRRGQSLGIIGRNGSGKSTLLQLICGILTPTQGSVTTKGRIAALLELGSGFNPEFTGVENIYLNSLLLGLSKRQTDERLDDILAFADIGDFVYQPIKTYSSGMIVRLAFSVIANSSPDILVVDEALSVGDIYFTQKCMRYIQRFRESNTLLFVSHDSASVASLCDSAILLNKGSIAMIGSPKRVTEGYTSSLYAEQDGDSKRSNSLAEESFGQTSVSSLAASDTWVDYRSRIINGSADANLLHITKFSESVLNSDSFGNGDAQITNVSLLEAATEHHLVVGAGGENVILRIEGIAYKAIDRPIIGFALKDNKGQVLLGDNTANRLERLQGHSDQSISKGSRFQVDFIFTMPLLPKGHYAITAGIANGSMMEHVQLQWITEALVFESVCTSIAAGLAGVAMHDIKLKVTT
jgi:lipopolysaccharide transport system ATP-binding protein